MHNEYYFLRLQSRTLNSFKFLPYMAYINLLSVKISLQRVCEQVLYHMLALGCYLRLFNKFSLVSAGQVVGTISTD